MATRTRTGGSATIQYENFQPKSEWQEEEGESVLLIHVPDFLKEELKITYVRSSRMVRVAGERPLAYNKRRRFDQTFPAPQNCEENRIQGKLQNGILSITMPKAAITQPLPKDEAKVTEETPLPSKDASAEKPMTCQVSQIPAMEPKAQRGMEDTGSFASPQEVLKDKMSQKRKAEAPVPEVASTTDTRKQKDEKRDRDQVSCAKTTDQKPIIGKEESTTEVSKKEAEPITGKALFERRESIETSKESLPTERYESSKKRKESLLTSGDASLTALEKNKETSVKFPTAGSEEKPKQDFNIAGKVKEVKHAAASAAKNTMKELSSSTKGLSEESQSMLYMGVAVLVIAALGAYIAYNYRSSRTSKD